jgi:glycosyltransferase involved in cell wall biosynthesis
MTNQSLLDYSKNWPWVFNSNNVMYDLSYEWPKISIVTPSYNQGSFLEETILSIINQKYPNLEYIIIDGGSTDNSIDIIKKYENHITYWVSEKDLGQSHAINKGFAQATGDILNWINSDDLLCENALSVIGKAYINRESDNVVIIGQGFEIDEYSSITQQRLVFNKTENKSDLYLKIEGRPIQQAIFYSKKLFLEAGGINPLINYPMDIDLYYKFGYIKPEIIVIDNFVASFRKHSNSKTVSQDYNMLMEKINLLEFLKIYDKKKTFYSNQISAYIYSFSFSNIDILKKLSLFKIFVRNTKFSKRNMYKFKAIFLNLIKKTKNG